MGETLTDRARDADRGSIGRHLLVGLVLVLTVVGGIGGWAATTQIAGAVMASGIVVVPSNVKKLQHAGGGIVGGIGAKDGDRVAAGDVLVRLDDTIARASLAILDQRFVELTARKRRLEAERDGRAIVDGQRQPEGADDTTWRKAIAGEARLFDLRADTRAGQKVQLGYRKGQLLKEIAGLRQQITVKQKEIVLIGRELAGARELWDRQLMPISKLTALEREATRLEGQTAQFSTRIASTNGRIAEIELQIVQIDRALASEVAKELRETDAQLAELGERRLAARDQLRRVDIRAPQSGVVDQSVVHTVGGVVRAGETLMLIVPDTDTLAIEARVAPRDVDQLTIGQPALLRFTAFEQRTTPEVYGRVERVSADAAHDGRSGARYYTVRIALDKEKLAGIDARRLVPGMPVEVFIMTAERRVLSYLVKPIRDQMYRALRAE